MRQFALVIALVCLSACASTGGGGGGGSAAHQPVTTAPVKSDSGLEFSVSNFSGERKAGEPIPVTIRFVNSSGYPIQLSQHVSAVVRNGKVESDWRIDLPLDHPIHLANGATFEWSLDLARSIKLKNPGTYDVIIGHENSVSTDLGNWKGAIYSQPQRVVIH